MTICRGSTMTSGDVEEDDARRVRRGDRDIDGAIVADGGVHRGCRRRCRCGASASRGAEWRFGDRFEGMIAAGWDLERTWKSRRPGRPVGGRARRSTEIPALHHENRRAKLLTASVVLAILWPNESINCSRRYGNAMDFAFRSSMTCSTSIPRQRSQDRRKRRRAGKS